MAGNHIAERGLIHNRQFFDKSAFSNGNRLR
jgi:hypothetical protein